MSNSLRSKISKLRHDRHITESEYQEIIKKLDGHDKKIRADAIDDVERELLANGFIVTHHALEVWHEIAEQLKEFENERQDS